MHFLTYQFCLEQRTYLLYFYIVIIFLHCHIAKAPLFLVGPFCRTAWPGRLLLVGGTGLDAHPVREVWAADMQRCRRLDTIYTVSLDVFLAVDDFMMLFGACFLFLLFLLFLLLLLLFVVVVVGGGGGGGVVVVVVVAAAAGGGGGGDDSCFLMLCW